MASPDRTLSMLARLQRIEEAKPRVSLFSAQACCTPAGVRPWNKLTADLQDFVDE